MKKVHIRVDASRCTQCSSCQLQCSLAYFKRFNPSQARIVVEPGNIFFTEDCIENCHLCADSCIYGALTKI